MQEVPQFRSLRVRTVGSMKGTKWEQLELARHCRGHVLFTLSGGAPIRHSRNVVTIHDAAVAASPAGYSLAYRLWHRNVCRRMARTAEHIFTVSNFSKSEIVKWYGADQGRVSVTYLGGDHFLKFAADHSALVRLGVLRPYALTAGVLNPNKNFDRIVQAACRHRPECGIPLVVAGGGDSDVYRSLQLPKQVCALGYVTDAELKTLYENASCFVFPSLYEGFGLPPLEALSLGCPIVVSRAGSLEEIFNNVAVFCDPYDPRDIASAIQRAAASAPSRGEDLKRFARKFSWADCARQTLEIIESLA